MINKFKSFFKKSFYKDRSKDIDPDEIFLDSENLPKFDVNQFEGRIEKSISSRTFIFFGIVCFLILGSYLVKTFHLQVVLGDTYLKRSENNRLRHTLLFAKRGVIYDRDNKRLAWNVAHDGNPEFPLRKYESMDGIAHVLGYIKYPQKDSAGFYYNEDFVGKAGVERFYNDLLSGENGLRIIEIDALGKLQSESVIRSPKDGEDIRLSVDSELQSYMYTTIKNLAQQVGFVGGAGVIMDVNTGEVIALTSYPEYNSQILTDGNDRVSINNFLSNTNKPFLDRVIDGLYTPGSIVKPFMSIAALSEEIIDPKKQIFSAGYISLPNPYNPENPSIFRDWKAHGYTDMRRAIAVSSDVYFYAIGGGYEDQKGLGIYLIEKYMSLFGFGKHMPEGFFRGNNGVIPTPEWKKINFNGEAWNIGNTYHTSIGQYGFQVTPIQIAQSIASIANNGKLIEPSIIYGGNQNLFEQLDIKQEYFQIIREGMKMSADVGGTASGINSGHVSIAGKTGTAEIGSRKQFVNSWVTGFFPYEEPRYSFAIIMERGPVKNTTGGVYVMRQILDWMSIHTPEYFSSKVQSTN